MKIWPDALMLNDAARFGEPGWKNASGTVLPEPSNTIPYAWLILPTFGTVPTTVFFPTLPNVIVLRFSFHVPPFLT